MKKESATRVLSWTGKKEWYQGNFHYQLPDLLPSYMYIYIHNLALMNNCNLPVFWRSGIWLNQNMVKYYNLIMLQIPKKKKSVAWNLAAPHSTAQSGRICGCCYPDKAGGTEDISHTALVPNSTEEKHTDFCQSLFPLLVEISCGHISQR